MKRETLTLALLVTQMVTPLAVGKPRGIAVAIGVNEVDPAHYGGWSGPLNACERDADFMAGVAKSSGFDSVDVLLTSEATREAVIGAIMAAANVLEAGDKFVISYSGHGGQVPDRNGDEQDRLDETWCLYDGQMIDDELFRHWQQFRPGVRIVVYSDSCHSGTVNKLAAYAKLSKSPQFAAMYGLTDAAAVRAVPPSADPTTDLAERFESLLNYREGVPAVSTSDETKVREQPRFRAMDLSTAFETYRKNQETYDEILSLPPVPSRALTTSVLLISGCQDHQLSLDGWEHGKFTGTLKAIWNNGGFQGAYADFHGAIVAEMPSTQTPNYHWVGSERYRFDGSRPWALTP